MASRSSSTSASPGQSMPGLLTRCGVGTRSQRCSGTLFVSCPVLRSHQSEVRSLVRASSLSIQLSIDPDIIRHREGELRQITLSVNDLQISCRTSYSLRSPDKREVGSSTLPRPMNRISNPATSYTSCRVFRCQLWGCSVYVKSVPRVRIPPRPWRRCYPAGCIPEIAYAATLTGYSRKSRC
jgi:hypothetical protein